MGLQRVPGVRGYFADSGGLRELAQSAQMQAATLAVAQRMAGNAEAVGSGSYEAAPQTVLAGWANERRAGAVVRETDPHWRDARDAVLIRVAEAMRVRSP